MGPERVPSGQQQAVPFEDRQAIQQYPQVNGTQPLQAHREAGVPAGIAGSVLDRAGASTRARLSLREHSKQDQGSRHAHARLRPPRDRIPDLRLQPLPRRGRGCRQRRRLRGTRRDRPQPPHARHRPHLDRRADQGQALRGGPAAAREVRETSRAREPRFPAGHRAFVDDLLTRYGVPELPGHIPAASGSIRVSAQDADNLLDVAFGHPIRLVASALGPPPAELVTQAHDRGVVVAALVGTAEHARSDIVTARRGAVAHPAAAAGKEATVAHRHR